MGIPVTRRIFIFMAAMLALTLVFAGSTLKSQPAAFVSVIPDLPLMAGLTEDAGAAVVFETASGRIAEAHASGALARQEVLKFYQATLPQLGWHILSDTRFQREGEVLSLEVLTVKGASKDIAVQFRLAPATRPAVQ